MVYWQVFLKSYARNMQYRLSHFINNLASAIFGFVSIAIWTGVLEGRESSSPYSIIDMTHYMAFNQCLLWMTTFLTAGLGIQIGVRNGAVSIELMRPVSFFLYTISQEAGRLTYNFFYRSIPIALVYVLSVGFYFPQNLISYVWTIISILLAMYLGLNLYYLTGIASFWTTEIHWAHFINITLMFSLGGQMIPLDLLPGILGKLSLYTPYAGILYHPTMIYLEKGLITGIWIQLFWACLLTLLNAWLTKRARTRMEIQGG